MLFICRKIGEKLKMVKVIKVFFGNLYIMNMIVLLIFFMGNRIERKLVIFFGFI